MKWAVLCFEKISWNSELFLQHFFIRLLPAKNPLDKNMLNVSYKTHLQSTALVIKNANTAQKMKFSIKDFFSICDQIRSFLRIWSHLLKKSLMENSIFCVVKVMQTLL